MDLNDRTCEFLASESNAQDFDDEARVMKELQMQWQTERRKLKTSFCVGYEQQILLKPFLLGNDSFCVLPIGLNKISLSAAHWFIKRLVEIEML